MLERLKPLLLTVVAGLAGFGLVSLIIVAFGFYGPLSEWLERWQTLIAVGVALASAGLAWASVQRQITANAELAETNAKRDANQNRDNRIRERIATLWEVQEVAVALIAQSRTVSGGTNKLLLSQVATLKGAVKEAYLIDSRLGQALSMYTHVIEDKILDALSPPESPNGELAAQAEQTGPPTDSVLSKADMVDGMLIGGAADLLKDVYEAALGGGTLELPAVLLTERTAAIVEQRYEGHRSSTTDAMCEPNGSYVL